MRDFSKDRLLPAVVAERLGFNRKEALSLGKAVAGLTAQIKGRRLGIFHPAPKEIRKARERKCGEEFHVELCGRPVPAVNTPDGVRAVAKGKPIEPGSVERNLEGKFGGDLKAARDAMKKLAASLEPEQIAAKAFPLYEKFRPAIPEGVGGWGAKGKLDLSRIRALSGKK